MKPKKCLSLLLAMLALLWAVFPCAKAEEEPESLSEISAKSAILMAADSGEILFARDARTPRPMASTTKIMTALLMLEEIGRSGDPVVTITEEMLRTEGSSMGLRAGDSLRLSELCAGLLLSSGNDAANAAAIFLCGSMEAFAEKMNERAAQLGMKDSFFVTPSGLDEEGHCASAYDMALLTRAAMKLPAFREIVACQSRRVQFLNPVKSVLYENHNKLLGDYEGCIGVKTGYTDLAGRCLVSAARRDGVELIAVTLYDPDDWRDHAALLDYGFSLLSCVQLGEVALPRIPVVGSSAESLGLFCGEMGLCLPKAQAEKLTYRVYLPRFVYGPLAAGTTVGRVRWELDGAPVCSVPIRLAESADGLRQ